MSRVSQKTVFCWAVLAGEAQTVLSKGQRSDLCSGQVLRRAALGWIPSPEALGTSSGVPWNYLP